MSVKPKLQAIDGGREALELEALLSFPTDFEKFVATMRSLAPAANDKLKLAPKLGEPDEKTDANSPEAG